MNCAQNVLRTFHDLFYGSHHWTSDAQSAALWPIY
jgi:hypothetical protein